MTKFPKTRHPRNIMVIFGLVLLCSIALYGFKPRGFMRQTNHIPGVLLVGHWDQGTKPMLLYIDPTDYSVRNIDVKVSPDLRYSGIHEAKLFIIGKEYKLALGTYMLPSLVILNSTNASFDNFSLDYRDGFPKNERIRAVFTGDITGDGVEEIIVGTRPGGIFKFYRHTDDQWIGTTIDTIGSAVHDIIIADLNRDKINEIVVSTSTVTNYTVYGLALKTPQILRYQLTANGWKREVLWEPQKLIIENGLYAHARYLVVGDFDGVDNRELVTGIKNESGLRSLLRLTWDGSAYTQFSQDINKGVSINGDILVSGDIDDDGKSELLMPTLTADALLLYKWQKNRWERQVLAKNLIDEQNQNEIIIAMAMLDSTSGGFKKILYVTAQNAETAAKHGGIDRVGKLYVLQFNAQHNQWEKTLVNTIKFPFMESWGMFPISDWKVYNQ